MYIHVRNDNRTSSDRFYLFNTHYKQTSTDTL